MIGTQSAAAVLNIMFIVGLMVGSTIVESAISENYGIRRLQQIHSRRNLPEPSATTLSAFISASICGGLGPVCPDGVHIECVVGGIVGCICALVRTCQPTVSGCTLFSGASVTPCGFQFYNASQFCSCRTPAAMMHKGYPKMMNHL